MNTIYERITALCNANGTTITALCEELKGSKGNLSTWRKGNLKADDLLRIADKFCVSVDYLLGRASENKDLESYNIERTIMPSFSIPAVFNEMPDLLSEERFINTAKVYYELPDEKREQAYMLICGIAIGLGLNIHNIIGRKL